MNNRSAGLYFHATDMIYATNQLFLGRFEEKTGQKGVWLKLGGRRERQEQQTIKGHRVQWKPWQAVRENTKPPIPLVLFKYQRLDLGRSVGTTCIRTLLLLCICSEATPGHKRNIALIYRRGDDWKRGLFTHAFALVHARALAGVDAIYSSGTEVPATPTSSASRQRENQRQADQSVAEPWNRTIDHWYRYVSEKWAKLKVKVRNRAKMDGVFIFYLCGAPWTAAKISASISMCISPNNLLGLYCRSNFKMCKAPLPSQKH